MDLSWPVILFISFFGQTEINIVDFNTSISLFTIHSYFQCPLSYQASRLYVNCRFVEEFIQGKQIGSENNEFCIFTFIISSVHKFLHTSLSQMRPLSNLKVSRVLQYNCKRNSLFQLVRNTNLFRQARIGAIASPNGSQMA